MGTTLSPEDELQIRALVARYHDAVCRADPEEWGATWATDATWHLGTKALEGRDAIVDFWWNRIMSQYETKIFHLLGQGRAWATPSGAGGRWTFLDIGRKTAEEKDHLEFCCYVDRYTQESGRWLFAERRFNLTYRGWMPPGDFFGFPPLDYLRGWRAPPRRGQLASMKRRTSRWRSSSSGVPARSP